MSKAWITLITRDSYLPGALVLATSLSRLSKYPLVALCTPDLSDLSRKILDDAGAIIRNIEYLTPAVSGELSERFQTTWTKLQVFSLFEYEMIAMLDSDMLVLQSMDELFEMDLPDGFIASTHVCTCNPLKISSYPRDWIPENCPHTLAKGKIPLSRSNFTKPTHHLLNSGIVVLKPCADSLNKILFTLQNDHIVSTFRFPDQDLLAYVFKDRFIPLGYVYNALKTLRYCHPNMWDDSEVKNVHYIIDKPWDKRVEDMNLGDPNRETQSWWWDAYTSMMQSWVEREGKDFVESLVAPEITPETRYHL